MNFLDLFSGIGGFALGAQWAGLHFEHHFFSEIDPFCCEIYGKHFPEAHALGSITELNGRKLVKEYGKEWIVTGGFPCQDTSTAGKRRGLDGNRSGLWTHYARVISEVKPRYVIIENVRGLFSLGFEQVLSDLSDMGFDAEWATVRAYDAGLPHNRQRVWIVAYPKGNGLGAATEQSTIRRDVGGGRQFNGTFDRLAVQAAWEEIEAQRSYCGESLCCRVADGLSKELHASYLKRVKALGNSIVPQIAAEIFRSLPL